MSSVNRVTLLGNLGADPEIRATKNGTVIARLRLATTRSYRDREGNDHSETEWHSVVILQDKLAQIAEKYLHKGDKVYLEGMLQTRKWQDQSGNDRYSTEVTIRGFDGKMVMLGQKRSSQDGQQESYQTSNDAPQRKPSDSKEIPDDDIPF